MTGMDIIANMNGKLRTFEAINGRKPSEEEGRRSVARSISSTSCSGPCNGTTSAELCL